MFQDEDGDNIHKSHDQIKQMPIYKKALEILNLVQHLAKSIETSDMAFKNEFGKEMLKHHLQFLRENSMIIPAKIAGAEGGGIYDLRMENAAIIRKAARELITDVCGIQMNGFKDTEYLDLLRKEVEEFRVIFAEWVKSFDPSNYIIDRWGLFNPSGVNYDDKDPDDDLPFNPRDFFSEELFGRSLDEDEDDDEVDEKDDEPN